MTERAAGGLIEAGWVGPWSDAVKVCVDWSRLHGHRHRIAWSAERGHWRITCITEPGSTES